MPAIRRQSRYAPAHAPFFFEEQASAASGSDESNNMPNEREIEHCMASSESSDESHQAAKSEAEEDALMRAADPALMSTADRLGEQLNLAEGRVDQELCPELEEVLARMFALREELGI